MRTAMTFRKEILKWCCGPVLDGSLDSELESLRVALLESRLDSTPPKAKSKPPGFILCFLPRDRVKSFLEAQTQLTNLHVFPQ